MRQIFFLCQITSRCICLRLITAHPSFCIFSTRLITLQLLYANYKVCFSASSLTSLEEKNNNNNTLVFITEPDAHKFDNGKINQRKVTCMYLCKRAGGAVSQISKYFSRSLKHRIRCTLQTINVYCLVCYFVVDVKCINC